MQLIVEKKSIQDSIHADKLLDVADMGTVSPNHRVRKMHLCKVCKTGKIKFGADFCEACRSFYKRHRNRTDFQCRSGSNDCLNDFPNPNSNYGVQRQLCQKCRIEICRQIKMVQPKIRATQQVPFDSGFEIEKSLTQIQSAASILTDYFSATETRQLIEWPYRTGHEAYMALSTTCERKLLKLKEFSRQFPFFKNLDVSDRAVLFLTSRFKVFCGENLLQPDGAYVVDFKTSVAHEGGKFVPFLSEYAEQAERTWIFMKNLNLDQVEKSFFLFFLHFGITPPAMSSKGKRQMWKGLKEIKKSFQAFLNFKYSLQHWKLRQAIFHHAVDRIGKESLWRTNILKTNLIPTFHQCGPTLFTSINNDGPEQYLTALKQRNGNSVFTK